MLLFCSILFLYTTAAPHLLYLRGKPSSRAIMHCETGVRPSSRRLCEAHWDIVRGIELYKWTWHVWATADRTECAVTEVWWSGRPTVLADETRTSARHKLRRSSTLLPRWQQRFAEQTTPHYHAHSQTHTHAVTDKHRLSIFAYKDYIFISAQLKSDSSQLARTESCIIK